MLETLCFPFITNTVGMQNVLNEFPFTLLSASVNQENDKQINPYSPSTTQNVHSDYYFASAQTFGFI